MTRAQRIGGRIGRALELAGMSKAHLARMVGVSPPTMGRYISGETEPAAEMVERIADALEVAPDFFYREDEETANAVAESLVRIFGDLMSGKEPDEAFDRETASPLWLNPRVREFLRSQAAAMRAAIERVAGRPWDSIEGADKQRVLQEFVHMVLPEEDLGLRRGESGGNERSLWPLRSA